MKRLIILAAAVAALIVVGGLSKGSDQRSAADQAPVMGPTVIDELAAAGIATAPDRLTVIGSLAEVTEAGMKVNVSSNREPIQVWFDAETKFCRGSCDSSWSDLVAGDQIVASALLRPGADLRVAQWVNANTVAGFVHVTELRGNEVVVETDRPYDKPELRDHWTLLIEPYTEFLSPDGTPRAREDIAVGDGFYFTGTRTFLDSPRIWAYRIFLSQ